jgi:hypothetical protein
MEQQNVVEVEKTYNPLWESYLVKLDDMDPFEKTKWMKAVDPLVELPFYTKNYFPLAEKEFLDLLESDEEFKEKWGQ